MSVDKLIDFKPQNASKTPFREPSSAISDLLKFAFSPKKREKTVNVSIRFLSDSEKLRKGKKLNHPRRQYTRKHDYVIPLMSALFLINSKISSKASINR